MRLLHVLGAILGIANLAAATGASAQSRGRLARIQLSDSVWAVVHIGSTDPSFMVHTPQGIFRLRADSSALASWAKAAASLAGPASGSGGGPDAQPMLSGSRLRATDESGNAMRLIRLADDTLSAYQLTVSNGAWDYAVRIAPDRVPLLFAALTGRDAGGLTWREPLVEIENPPGYRPALTVSGNRAPRYPPLAELHGQAGQVRAQFTIGPDGRVRPETLLIVHSSHPLFARAVRDAIPSMRFTPATRDGIPVDDTVFQQFEFRVP